MTKVCRNCGESFDTNKYKVFCSEDCRNDYNEHKNTHEATCNRCGKKFLVPIRMDGTYHKRFFCSDECSKLDYREKTKYKEVTCVRCNKKITIERDEKTNRFPRLSKQLCNDCANCSSPKENLCRYCGKTFTRQSKSSTTAFCSKACYDAYNMVQAYGSVTPTGICKYCGKTFNLPKDVNGRYNIHTMFCSSDCANKQYFIEHPLPDRYCATCGKLLVRGRNEDLSNFKRRIYCENPDCKSYGQVRKFRKTCMERYGVPYACLLDQARNESKKVSKINREFASTLEDLGLQVELDTVVLGCYSYDIYLKGTNTLIEINPTYTHNVFGNHFNDWKYDSRLETKHLVKSNTAKSYGYHCLHIWQWDDVDKIFQILVPNKQKCFARKLSIRSVDKRVANAFLDSYHLQNSCYGNSVNLGLYQGEQLIQVMTFGKPRYNKNYQWELLRLCTRPDSYVVGGAERLFKHFVRKYNPESVISYCDISKFSGGVYERLGFSLLRQSKPQKIWSKGKRYITDNLLRQRGADQLIGTHDGKGTDNEEIMVREGWLPVYDCGQKVFIWLSSGQS